MPKNKRDFRNQYERVDKGTLLTGNVWYRSPLWEYDHLVGEDHTWYDDQIAWCGRGLGAARDGWGDKLLEGLWVSTRRGNKCATCKRRQAEWNAAMASSPPWRQ